MASKYPTPQAAITFNPGTRLYGFSVWFPGKCPHYEMESFRSLANAQAWLDPWNERMWEDAGDADPALLAISRGFKPDTVPARV